MKIAVIKSIDNEGWSIIENYCKHLSSTFFKSEAIEQGRAIARLNRTRLYIHKSDGTVDFKEDYSNDSN